MTTSGILFGSIGTLIETSEIQRQAFNQAFEEFNLDWYWTPEYYRDQLALSGGQNRIAVHAAARGMRVDAQAIHSRKTEIFNEQLLQGGVVPRPGVLKTIHYARRFGMKLAFVTTTSKENVECTLACLEPYIAATVFDHIGTADDVGRSKPAPDAYHLALAKLGLHASSCLAIEDSQPSLAASRAAGIPTIAFPGANTSGQDFSGATAKTTCLDMDVMLGLEQATI